MPRLPKEGKVLTGLVKRFREDKGYGFILDSNNDEYFVYYKDITGEGYRNLASGQRVKFLGKEGPKGLYATEVSVILNNY